MAERLNELWQGGFGNDYHQRQESSRESLIKKNQAFFQCIDIDIIPGYIGSVLELGAGTGLNLEAWQQALTGYVRNDSNVPQSSSFVGVEINAQACEIMRQSGFTVHEQSFVQAHGGGDIVAPWGRHDLVMTKGVLIHLDEAALPRAYDVMYHSARHYIMMAEYFSPRREMVPYRGQDHIMFRDDYAAGLWSRYPDLTFLASGFAWSKDPEAAQDDLTWFVFEKGSQR